MAATTTSNISDEILIVGAGPSGLILAYELLRRKVPIRLIEKRKGSASTTRAISITARSMEMFDHMGLAHRLKDVCLECPGNMYRFPGMPEEKCPRTDYRVLPSRYAAYFKICQNDFEQVLRGHLLTTHGVIPEYRTELVGLSVPDEADGPVTATIKLPTGEDQTISYPWVVGCDGVRSFVRQAAGIPFNGKIVTKFTMVDATLTNVNFDDRWMNYFFNQEYFMLVTRMPGKAVWRLYMGDSTGKYVQMEDRQKGFQAVCDLIDIGVKVANIHWASTWDVHNNIAEKYRKGKLIVCGDASHVHSPSGGQGMNGCMQDAFNLGWKLAAVWKGQANASILDSYETERKPIGELITKASMATHTITMGFQIPIEERLRMTQDPDWEDITINMISGMSHNYLKVVKVPKILKPVPGPAAGQRAPDALLLKSPQRLMYDVFRRPQFTVLVIPSIVPAKKTCQLELAITIREAMDARFPKQVATYLISDQPEKEFDFDFQSTYEGTQVLERYHIDPSSEQGRLVLVRPDLYVGMSCEMDEWKAVLECMEQWYNPVPLPN